jgi:hypothetical protein
MKAGIQYMVRQRAWFRRRRRQDGGETVEFALLVGLTFLLLFGIIEFSIAMYDQGALIHASRTMAREASLFWVDVTQMGPDTDPEDDQRINTSEVEDAVSDYLDQYMISFTEAEPDLFLQGQPIGSLPEQLIVGDQPDRRVNVRSELLYHAPVTSALADLLDIDMVAPATMGAEQ